MADPLPDAPLAIDRFDGVAAWLELAPDSQAAIGAMALELGAALAAQTILDALDGRASPVSRATEAAYSVLVGGIEEAVTDVAPELADRPHVPALLGQVCRVCGCSENDACDEGCSWAELDLCTACEVDPAEAARG